MAPESSLHIAALDSIDEGAARSDERLHGRMVGSDGHGVSSGVRRPNRRVCHGSVAAIRKRSALISELTWLMFAYVTDHSHFLLIVPIPGNSDRVAFFVVDTFFDVTCQVIGLPAALC